MRRIIYVIFACVCLFSCNEQNGEQTDGKLLYVKTECGGCNNLRSATENNVPKAGSDTVQITFTDNLLSVFVNLNYTCKNVPFKTECEMVDDVLCMYIIDECSDIADCYQRCTCYYTFDFTFQWQGTINQKYKIILNDPRKEDAIIISEGKISNDGNSHIKDDYPKNVYFSDSTFVNTSCSWKNLSYKDEVIIINSSEELKNYITCSDIDFAKYTLLVASGACTSGIQNITKKLINTEENKYSFDIDITLNETAVAPKWVETILIPKISQNAVIYLTVNRHR